MVDIVVRRSLKKNLGIFISINVMIFITILLSVIATLSYTIGYDGFQAYKEDVNLEDFQMQTINELSKEEIEGLQDDYDLKIQVDNKYINVEEDKQITIYEQDGPKDISKVKLLEGSANLQDNQIILSQSYANYNNLEIGQNIQINDYDLEIVGLSFFAEDIFPVKGGSVFPEKENIATAFVNENTFKKIAGPELTTTLYRGKFITKPKDKSSVYERIKEDLTTEVIETNILSQPTKPIAYKEQSNVISLVDYIKNINIGILELEFQFVSIIIFGMSILIGLITIILSIFLFKSIVQKQRREIGILRAFGVYKSQIINSYSKIFSISIIIVCIFATILGCFAYYGLNNLYKEFFIYIEYPITIKAPIILTMVIVLEAFFLMIAVRYVSIKRNLSVSIINMVKNVDDKKNQKKIKKPLFRFKKFTTNLKFNVIIRNGGKTLLLVYGIIFSTFLLVFAFTMVFAVNDLQDNIYGDEFSYEYEAVFSPGFQTDKNLYNDQSIIYFPANIKDNNEDVISVLGYDVANKYININNDVKLKGNEVYISNALATKFDLKVDDVIEIHNTTNTAEKYQFKVKDIAQNHAEEKIYANINYLQDILDVDDTYYNGYVGSGQTKNEISQGDDNMTYYSPQEIIKGMSEYTTLINVVIIGISVFAFTIALIALGVTTNIIIKNNEKIISIMKVLGYNSKEINNLIISGYRPIVIIGFIIAFPLSAIGVKYYVDFIFSLIDGLNYPLVLRPNIVVFTISFIIIILSFETTLFLTKRKINKIKLSKALNVDE